jgi:hypothetical protein
MSRRILYNSAYAFALSLALATTSTAQAAKQAAPATTNLVLDGLEIEFDDDGDWVRMYSTYRQPVSFPDRVGLRKAYTIAEEKGKAQIIRFMQEKVTSERLVEEVSRESQTAVRNQKDGKEAISRTTQREMVESIKEFTRSYSAGTLRGVTVLEQGYDEKAEEVWVKIGLSRRSAALGQKLQGDLADPKGSQPSRKTNGGTDGAAIRQGGELRTRKPPF